MAKASIQERFWSKVHRTDTCWTWKAFINQRGYGRFCINYRMHTASRVAWMLTNGPIPDGLFVCHHCDNRACVNPSHLFLGTNQENLIDMIQKGRQSHLCKLTPSDVLSIRSDTRLQRIIAADYGVSQCRISVIKSLKSRKHL